MTGNGPSQDNPLSPGQRKEALDTFLDGKPYAVAKIDLNGDEVMVAVRRGDGHSGDYNIQCLTGSNSGEFRANENGERMPHKPLNLAAREIRDIDVVVRELTPEVRLGDKEAIMWLELNDSIESAVRSDPEGFLAASIESFQSLRPNEVLDVEPHQSAELQSLLLPLNIHANPDESLAIDGEYISVQLICAPSGKEIHLFLSTPEEREHERSGGDFYEGPVIRHEDLLIGLQHVASGEILTPVRTDYMLEFVGIEPGAEYQAVLMEENPS